MTYNPKRHVTNYRQPETVTKRARFYDDQFLIDQDFIDEQKYHVDRQARHHQTLHLPGIAEGLDITLDAGKAKITSGTAIDDDGRQIVLAKDQTIDISGAGFVYIAFDLHPSDRRTGEGVAGATRWEETPYVFFHATKLGKGDDYPHPPDRAADWWHEYLDDGPPPPVLLAEVTSGSALDLAGRLYSGVRLPSGGDTTSAILRTDNAGNVQLMQMPDSTNWTPRVTVSKEGNVGIGMTRPGTKKLSVLGDTQLTGHVTVSQSLSASNGTLVVTDNGNVGIGSPNPVQKLEVTGATKVTGNVTVTGELTAHNDDFVVKPTGVGIGKSNPTKKLDVVGDAHFQGDTGVSGDVTVGGGMSAATFTGNGAGLTHLNAIPIGCVMPYMGQVAPAGWLMCRGDRVSEHDYPVLCELLGQKGKGTFTVPNLQGQFLIGSGRSTQGTNYALGQTGGQESVTLATSQLPAHTHPLNDGGHSHTATDSGHGHGVTDPKHQHHIGQLHHKGSYYGDGNGDPHFANDHNTWTEKSATGITIQEGRADITVRSSASNISMHPAGGGQSHENRPPFFVINYIIKAKTV